MAKNKKIKLSVNVDLCEKIQNDFLKKTWIPADLNFLINALLEKFTKWEITLNWKNEKTKNWKSVPACVRVDVNGTHIYYECDDDNQWYIITYIWNWSPIREE